MSELYDTSDSPRVTRAVQWLLALNIGVYFLQLTLFGSDAIYSALALDPARFPANWWTVLSYMFVHAWLAQISWIEDQKQVSSFAFPEAVARGILHGDVIGDDDYDEVFSLRRCPDAVNKTSNEFI